VKILKTYTQIKACERAGIDFLQATGHIDEKGYTEKNDTPLTGALKKVLKRIGNINIDYEDKIDNIRILNAARNPSDNTIIREEKCPKCNMGGSGYKFTPEGLIKLKAEVKEFLKTEVEILPCVVTDYKEQLNNFEREAFSEFVIPKQEFENEPE
jgi:hypothetical protein